LGRSSNASEVPYVAFMTIRARKFIGTIATLVYMICYTLIAMAIGGQYVVGVGMLGELAFYIIAGLAWIPGSMFLINWMSRPDPDVPNQ
jgi:hypothetical protein